MSNPAPLLLRSNTEPVHAWGGSQRTRTPSGASWLTADCCLKPRWWAPVLVTAPPLLGGPLRPLQSPYRVATPPSSPTQGVSYHLREPTMASLDFQPCLWSLGRATLTALAGCPPHARLRVEAHSAPQPPTVTPSSHQRHPSQPRVGAGAACTVDAPAQQGSPSPLQRAGSQSCLQAALPTRLPEEIPARPRPHCRGELTLPYKGAKYKHGEGSPEPRVSHTEPAECAGAPRRPGGVRRRCRPGARPATPRPPAWPQPSSNARNRASVQNPTPVPDRRPRGRL